MNYYGEGKMIKSNAKRITGLLLIVALAGYTVACSQQTKKSDDTAMVITFVTGDAKVVHTAANTEDAAKIGMVVRESDQIKTTTGTVDLQSRTGSAIRVREFTTITVAKLAGTDGNETRIGMEHGGLLATVNKSASNEDFNVVTPTAVAGVRGTTFSVDVEDGQRPRVKVVEGKVAMAPRIAALEEYSEEEIASSKELTKLSEIQAAAEIVLEDKTEGTLDEKLEEQVMKVNEALKVARKEERKIEDIALVPGVTEAVQLVEKVEKKEVALVDTKEAEFTPQEEVEHQTLVVIESDVLAGVLEKGENNVESVSQLKEIRAQQEEVILQKIEEAASEQKLESEEEIKKHYNKLELITLKNGEKISGAVIAQTGDLMVIHSADGVRRVEKSEVEAQEFLY
jgi:hypothetical protein